MPATAAFQPAQQPTVFVAHSVDPGLIFLCINLIFFLGYIEPTVSSVPVEVYVFFDFSLLNDIKNIIIDLEFRLMVPPMNLR